jgi:hypothetical protein
MEEELNDLRQIVNSRTMIKVVEENLDWWAVLSRSYGTRIKYILGKDSSGEVKEMADVADEILKKMIKMQEDHRIALSIKQEEIEALKKVTWYQKLFNKK